MKMQRRARVSGTILALASMGMLAGCASSGSAASSGGGQTPQMTPASLSEAAGTSSGVVGHTFHENFRFKGDHAFTTSTGGDAVWWNQDNWDVRNDTANEATQPVSEADPYQGLYAAIEKAKNPSNPKSSAVNTSVHAPNGDGSAGIGVMRVDFQGTESARLRNPMLISAARPATVSFRAPLFVTTGHWWEISITPTDKPYAAEYSAIPGRQIPESLNDPITGSSTDGGTTNGPGHRAVVDDSINVISTGFPDGPTCNGSGWHARWAVTQASNGHVTDHVNPRHSMAKLQKVNPDDMGEMYPWKVVYTPSLIKLYSDLKDTGHLSLVEQWKIHVPWSQVYVNFLHVAYQAGHHPQPNCGMHTHGVKQGAVMAWSHISVSPVKYARTYAVPGPTATARKDGWMSYDLRDVNDHKGKGQPNSKDYDKYLSYLYCSVDNGGGLPCPTGAVKTVKLTVSITAQQLQGLQRAQFIGDVRHAGNTQVTINGHRVGVLLGQPVRPNYNYNGYTDEFEPDAWVRHGVDIPNGVLHAGVNHVTLSLDQKVDASLDRLQIELDDN